MNHLKYILSFFITALFFGCQSDKDRKIRLAQMGSEGLMQDQVATIQFAAARKKTIAVMNFANKTGEANLDWLQQGIAEMLVTDLAQSRHLNLLPSEKISEAFHKLGIDERRAHEPEIGLQAAHGC